MHIREEMNLDTESTYKSKLSLSTWIDNNNKPVSVIGICTGSCHTQNNLNKDDAEHLIMLLQRHIHNIKTVEQEVMQREIDSANDCKEQEKKAA